MRIFESLTESIGKTPLLHAHRIEEKLGLKAQLLLKLECMNPGGSVKDRAALAMIEAAEQDGSLRPGGTIIEPTSGNTGVGLSWIAAMKGYKAVFTMPESMSVERRQILSAMGAEVVLTPAAEGMAGAIRRAEELRASTPGAIIPMQFSNPANPEIHRRTTAEEIWQDTDGQVAALVSSVGTGGTLSGTAAGLKSHNPEIKVIAVEPAASPVISGGKPGPHKIQGIGAGFIPENYHSEMADEVMTVTEDEAFETQRLLALTEGAFCGISSGAALAAAIRLARRPEFAGRQIAVILPDTGTRYLSMLPH